jgi:hypothetical protein
VELDSPVIVQRGIGALIPPFAIDPVHEDTVGADKLLVAVASIVNEVAVAPVLGNNMPAYKEVLAGMAPRLVTASGTAAVAATEFRLSDAKATITLKMATNALRMFRFLNLLGILRLNQEILA